MSAEHIAVPLLNRAGDTVAHAIVDTEDAWVLERRWYLHPQGYAASGRRVAGRLVVTYMHRSINKTPEGVLTDHLDEDKLNNRRSNLRNATRSTNCLNRGRSFPRATALPRNVYRLRRKFIAKAVVGGRQVHIGTFTTPEAASAAVDAWFNTNIPIQLATRSTP